MPEGERVKSLSVCLRGSEPSLGALQADIARLHEALNEIMAAAQEDPRTFKGFNKRWSPQDPFKTDFPMHQGGLPWLHGGCACTTVSSMFFQAAAARVFLADIEVPEICVADLGSCLVSPSCDGLLRW